MSCLARSLQPSCTASAGISPSEYQSRSTQWAYAALGVAWVTRVVVTMPTDLPEERKQHGAQSMTTRFFGSSKLLLILMIQEYILSDILL